VEKKNKTNRIEIWQKMETSVLGMKLKEQEYQILSLSFTV